LLLRPVRFVNILAVCDIATQYGILSLTTAAYDETAFPLSVSELVSCAFNYKLLTMSLMSQWPT